MLLHVSVILFTGGGGLPAHTRGKVGWSGWGGGVSRPIPRGEVEGSGQGGLQAHTQGEVGGSAR